ncbi:hypothetical protein RB195_012165 [Necator americanus]|uniref:Uncharacterized protein n=1 Tax=Necator americanus TaxID=51031 RepID=A0ABR1D7S0_NECAM
MSGNTKRKRLAPVATSFDETIEAMAVAVIYRFAGRNVGEKRKSLAKKPTEQSKQRYEYVILAISNNLIQWLDSYCTEKTLDTCKRNKTAKLQKKMFRFLLLLLVLSQDVHGLIDLPVVPFDYDGGDDAIWALPPKINVTLYAIHNFTDIREDFESLFSDFATEQGLHLNKDNFRRSDDGPDPNISWKATYELTGVHCIELENHLLRLVSPKFNIAMLNVNCGRLKYAICFKPGCPKKFLGRESFERESSE